MTATTGATAPTKPQRWYAVFPSVGKATVKAEKLKQAIKVNRLGAVVPRMCFQRPIPGRYHSECYIGVAFDGAAPGEFPLGASILLQPGFLGQPLHDADGRPKVFAVKELRSWMGAEVDTADYARTISFRRLTRPRPEDPFGALEVGGQGRDGADDTSGFLDRTVNYDRLLHWLTAMGTGGMTAFQSACSALGITGADGESRRVLRRLRLLGHVETSADGARWSIAPSVLTRVTTAEGEPAYVLCGARTPATVQALHEAGSVISQPQPFGDAPSVVMARDLDGAHLLAAGLTCTHVTTAALDLARLLPDIDGWVALLPEVPGVRPHSYRMRRWGVDGFIDTATADVPGLYELSTEDGNGRGRGSGGTQTFYRDAAGCWRRGDWYGLRYAGQLHADGPAPAGYNETNRELALLADRRLPEVYERALVLASGLLPERRKEWLIYAGVTPPLLESLAAKAQLDVQRQG